MPSEYLQAAEAPQYGLKAIDSTQIVQASALLDAYLRRPEGLVWMPDSVGRPCYMAALDQVVRFALAGPIAPGVNVPVELAGPTDMLAVGDVLILDRPAENASASATEACIIAKAADPAQPQIVLQSVMNSHAEGASADYGLAIEERRLMPANRPITTLSRTPVIRVLSGIGRYGYGRRGDGANWNLEAYNLLAAVSKFGGPPVWELWNVPLGNYWDPTTGQLWAPAGIMLQYYSEIKVRYVAGFPASAIPPMVKLACAQVIRAMATAPPMGDVRSFRAGDTQVARFTASVLDADVRRALRPFIARAYA